MRDLRYKLKKPVKITIENFNATILLEIIHKWSADLYSQYPDSLLSYLCIELEEDLREKWCDRSGQIKVNFRIKTALLPTKWLVLKDIISREIDNKGNTGYLYEAFLITLSIEIEDILIGKK